MPFRKSQPLHLTPNLTDPKCIHFWNRIWPRYILDNQPNGPSNGILDPTIFQDIYKYIQWLETWKEVPYSLLLFSPLQALLVLSGLLLPTPLAPTVLSFELPLMDLSIFCKVGTRSRTYQEEEKAKKFLRDPLSKYTCSQRRRSHTSTPEPTFSCSGTT